MIWIYEYMNEYNYYGNSYINITFLSLFEFMLTNRLVFMKNDIGVTFKAWRGEWLSGGIFCTVKWIRCLEGTSLSNCIWKRKDLSSAFLRKLCLRVKYCWFSIPNRVLMFHFVLWAQSWLLCFSKDLSPKFACKFGKEGSQEGNQSCWDKSCNLETHFKVRQYYQTFYLIYVLSLKSQ